ncbi:phosphatidylinositol mannoside acyltransferase [Streptosporangiaceae bacterium NEAU-GS5]|nr:phosphatidylinositol mannoside acyltransferase [Streptosporangiaceae bacterium NEAU-GS5]
MTDRLVATAYHVGWVLLPKVPEPVAAWLFRRIADIMWRRRGRSVLRLESNLARVVGPDADLRALSREGLRSYFRYWMEALRLPAMSRDHIVSHTRITGGEIIFKAVDEGRGIVLALPHMGNWDAAGAWMVGVGYPFTTVMERLKPESLFERFVAYRESLGMEVLPLTRKEGGSAQAFGTLARRLRDGKAICLPAERDLTNSGVEIEFFGATAKMVAGPALLALQTGAPLHPVTLWYEGENWGIWIHDEVPVPEHGDRKEKVAAMTQAMARVFEEGIAAHPQDWHMLQRLWLDDLK